MIKILTAILVPPLSVFVNYGLGRKFYFNVFLTVCGVVPGVVHAIWSLSEAKQGFGLDRLMGKS